MPLKTITDSSGAPIAYLASAGKTNGRKLRKRFSCVKFGSAPKAKAAATRWEASTRAEKAVESSTLIAVPAAARADIIRAYELLEPYDVPLLDVVRDWIRLSQIDAHKHPWTYSEAANALIEHHRASGRSVKHIYEQEHFARFTCTYFGPKLCDAIGIDDLNAFMAGRDQLLKKKRKTGLSVDTRLDYRQRFGALFNFAVAQGHATKNPALAMPKPKRVDKPVEILTLSQVRKFLGACELKLLPIVVTALFTGIRPEELVKLTPASFLWHKKKIDIKGPHAKSRKRREPDMNETFLAWALPIRPLFGKHLPPKTFQRARNRASKLSGVKLPRDVFRHCFASYYLELTDDPGKTAKALGHRNQDLLYTNYRDLVTKNATTHYWALRPNKINIRDPEVAKLY